MSSSEERVAVVAAAAVVVVAVAAVAVVVVVVVARSRISATTTRLMTVDAKPFTSEIFPGNAKSELLLIFETLASVTIIFYVKGGVPSWSTKN